MSQLTDYLYEGDLESAVCEKCGVEHNPRKPTEPTLHFIVCKDNSKYIRCRMCITEYCDQKNIKEDFTAKTEY
jgi:hypothetical protein